MPPRNPNKIQLDFPELTADLISQLKLVGTVGLLDFAATVSPVFIIGDRDLTVKALAPVYQSSEVFHASSANPGVNGILADTGQLAAGSYDIFAEIAWVGSTTVKTAGFRLQHRNASDNGTLATLSESLPPTADAHGQLVFPATGYKIGLNERLRYIAPFSEFIGQVASTIAAAVRVIP